MSEKRMLIIDAEVAKKIDENRGDMGRSDFINFLVDSHLGLASPKTVSSKVDYINREEFSQFQQGIKDLLRNFMEFFLSYGLELGQQPDNAAMKELSQQLQAFVNRTKNNN